MFAGCHEVGRSSGSAGGRLPQLISLLARFAGAAALLWAAGSVSPCQTKPFPDHRGGISNHLPAGAVVGRAGSGRAGIAQALLLPWLGCTRVELLGWEPVGYLLVTVLLAETSHRGRERSL